ncbi:hypothetical protein EDC04DRAFT_2612452 [Pisolithus marmoratus]|nr:hypothetical protein EDC04DRAFT_2612452 [Pisolithus marmoratus]
MEDPDWVFTCFSELHKLFNIQMGHSWLVIEGKTADVTVYIHVLKDPTGVLWFEECLQLQAKRKHMEESLFLTAREMVSKSFTSPENEVLAVPLAAAGAQQMLPTLNVDLLISVGRQSRFWELHLPRKSV